VKIDELYVGVPGANGLVPVQITTVRHLGDASTGAAQTSS
jgi:hypothetical protein